MVDVDVERETAVRRYYESLDTHDYDGLALVLAPDFSHHRPDRTIDGRDRFVRFMREERPLTDTTHRVDDLLISDDRTRIAARGRLFDADGAHLFGFVDVHEFAPTGTIARTDTYTR